MRYHPTSTCVRMPPPPPMCSYESSPASLGMHVRACVCMHEACACPMHGACMAHAYMRVYMNANACIQVCILLRVRRHVHACIQVYRTYKYVSSSASVGMFMLAYKYTAHGKPHTESWASAEDPRRRRTHTQEEEEANYTSHGVTGQCSRPGKVDGKGRRSKPGFVAYVCISSKELVVVTCATHNHTSACP